MVPILALLASLPIAWTLLALAVMRRGRTRPSSNARFDAVVVLGCRVLRDGTPGPAFAQRIALGCELVRAGVAPKLVITGGKVRGPITEAEAARAHIEKRALARIDSLVLEDRATSTRTNASLTRALLGDARVVVVTTDWHVPRARRVFERSFTVVQCASAPGKIRGALREVVPWVIDRAEFS